MLHQWDFTLGAIQIKMGRGRIFFVLERVGFPLLENQ